MPLKAMQKRATQQEPDAYAAARLKNLLFKIPTNSSWGSSVRKAFEVLRVNLAIDKRHLFCF